MIMLLGVTGGGVDVVEVEGICGVVSSTFGWGEGGFGFGDDEGMVGFCGGECGESCDVLPLTLITSTLSECLRLRFPCGFGGSPAEEGPAVLIKLENTKRKLKRAVFYYYIIKHETFLNHW